MLPCIKATNLNFSDTEGVSMEIVYSIEYRDRRLSNCDFKFVTIFTSFLTVLSFPLNESPSGL